MYLESKCGNGPNTIDRDAKRLKAVVHLAQKLELIKEDPFINFKSQTVVTHRICTLIMLVYLNNIGSSLLTIDF